MCTASNIAGQTQWTKSDQKWREFIGNSMFIIKVSLYGGGMFNAPVSTPTMQVL